MLYKKGTILKYQNEKGWYLLKVTKDYKVEGVVIHSQHPDCPLGTNDWNWSFDWEGRDVGWSVYKESNILRLLEKIDNG